MSRYAPSRSRVSPKSKMATLTSGNVRVQSTLDPQRADECVELIDALKFAGQSLIATVLNEDSRTTFPLKLAFALQLDALPRLDPSEFGLLMCRCPAYCETRPSKAPGCIYDFSLPPVCSLSCIT